jgi:hypothetical protein
LKERGLLQPAVVPDQDFSRSPFPVSRIELSHSRARLRVGEHFLPLIHGPEGTTEDGGPTSFQRATVSDLGKFTRFSIRP